ncbi:hypothetical protein, partial [uncultured Ruminococcus sp.]|uniref:hypothetical protein n=1 Tax=uncultured Ruminococcus sp. TaxID=165186 RepID=UPI0025E11C08
CRASTSEDSEASPSGRSALTCDKGRIIHDRVIRHCVCSRKHHRVRGQVAPHSSGREIIELRR